MLDAKIIRKERIHGATIGLFVVDYEIQCFTLEDPWRNNHSFSSCIPAGRYQCQKVDSPKFGPTYEILDIPDRDDCVFQRSVGIRGCGQCSAAAPHLTP